MSVIEIEIINKLGLHARAASKFVGVASGYDANVMVSNGNREVNAKSIMGVMMLAASKGTKLTLNAEGPDADDALKALVELTNSRFGEAE